MALPDIVEIAPVPAVPVDAGQKIAIDYRQLFERCTTPTYVYQMDSLRILAVNQAALAFYGYSESEFLGLRVTDLYPQADFGRALRYLELPLGERLRQRAWRHRRRDGTLVEVEVMRQDVDLGEVRACALMVTDHTAALHARNELAENGEMLNAVVNAATDAIVAVDGDGRIRMFNHSAERLFGRSAQSMLGQPPDLLMPPEARAQHASRMAWFAEYGPSTYEIGLGRPVRGLRADGTELSLLFRVSKVEVAGDTLPMACIRDVTEERRLDAEFQRSRKMLSDLTQRLMTQESRLIKSIAQTLHDSFGQTMAALRMAHETVLALQESQGAVVSPEVARMQEQMGELIARSVTRIRQVLVDLRPTLLEERGFVAALDNELRNRARSHPALDLVFRIAPEIEQMRWPTDVEYVAFMVAREAIENALRHSGSPSLMVRVTGDAASLQLEVADDGEGMPTAAPEHRAAHFGILSMHERANAIGARVVVDSAPAMGTRVSFSWASAS